MLRGNTVTSQSEYLMESNDESIRLDLKTDARLVEKQALWAGIKPGMRVVDLGCGAGKTTAVLHQLVQPGGEVVGVDISDERLEYARENYGGPEIHFKKHDIRTPLTDLGKFDFAWSRFVLEYHLSSSFTIAQNITNLLKEEGIICLIDLDHNCLSHHGQSERMERTLKEILAQLQEKADFDPFVGRKLYAFLYDLNYEEISVEVGAHHLIYGELRDADAFNWLKKVEVAPKKIGFQFLEYPGGHQEFVTEFNDFFRDPRRFTYSPIIACRGRKTRRTGQ